MALRKLDLTTLKLQSGGHSSPKDGMCFMEAVAYFAGEKHSDHPACVSPVLGAFLRKWNDDLDDAGRQRLVPYIPRVIGTAGDGADDRRAWLLVDWLVREHTPAWLELGGMSEQAAALRALPELTSEELLVRTAQPRLEEARRVADAAWAAAWDAAWDAAWAAAMAAAMAAAWSAAMAAAWDAAMAAARSAAMAAARSAAMAAAWDAAMAAAEGKPYESGYAAAYAAVMEKLKPTSLSLQSSAELLLERLIEAGREAGAAEGASA